ncbi:MiaB/RimO family radical SAM methylthiotransferase, partial [candidate division WOR-3 bacterium]|nr:MiaB/RimO family radical SAM methylthiotransferase [candidate division WOR-3 bacterium]MBD3364378.1 MiaB/RimO family radical SAM methylthiotransferase [candidate division WOR-3 bacterium]
LPQRQPRQLIGMFPWVDCFVGIDQIPNIPQLILEGTRPGNVKVTSPASWNPGSEFPRFLSTPPHYAYLRIAEGCSNRCSYCTVPLIRGPLRLRNPKDIIHEACSLVSLGVREIILIAQDTAAHPELKKILQGLNDIEGLRWIRLLYAHPRHLDEDILEQIVSLDKVLNYLDMPVQHLASPVLERMNRQIDSQRINDLVNRARSLDKDFSIRTTVITGLPGETEGEFKILLEGLERLRFTNLGIFIYSREDSTVAADMPDQIPLRVKEQRALKLIDLAERLRTEEIKKLKGSMKDAVVDFTDEGEIIGRLWSDAPEIDRILEITEKDVDEGTFGRVKITGGKHDSLFARWIESV